jgi:hypothetical protein
MLRVEINPWRPGESRRPVADRGIAKLISIEKHRSEQQGFAIRQRKATRDPAVHRASAEPPEEAFRGPISEARR